jgi:N-acetylmuramoyl-L-alanine amidase
MPNLKIQMSKICLKQAAFLLIFGFCHLTLFSQSRLDVIYIDAGHGGKDPGTIGDNTGVQEKNIVLPIAVKLGRMIEDKYPGIKIIYSRTTDEFSAVKDRSKTANENKAKLYISIHANHKKKEESEKNGFEIYLLNRERFPEAVQFTINENFHLNLQQNTNDTLDRFIFASLAQNGYTKLGEYFASIIEVNMLSLTSLLSRGIIQAGNWVNLEPSMPSVLVETGYLSDINDERYLSSERGQNDVSIALFKAFQQYKVLYESQ